jgi:hypothetical protein
MSPAFSSNRQAAAFALLLAFILLLPALMGKSLLPPREQIYSSLPWGAGSFPYLDDQIFHENEDIDIAFMGSSRMWWGIDTPQVEAQLSQKLGRKAVVRTLCWNAPGFDPFYFTLQDLLAHRKVRVLVFGDCLTGSGNAAHPRAVGWFRLADNAEGIAGLPFRSQLTFYASAILGTPRNVLGLLRTNLPAIPTADISWEGRGTVVTNVTNPFLRGGSLAVRMNHDRPFRLYRPQIASRPEDVRVYSEATQDDFHFSRVPVPPMQAAFMRKIGALAAAHRVKLVYLHLPLTTEMKSAVIEESFFWPDLFGAPVAMVGIPPAKLFGGLTEPEELDLFSNYEHLNQNGQEYFTAAIAPGLVQLYEDQTKP